MEGTRTAGSGPFMPRKPLKAPPRAPERTRLGVGMPVNARTLQKSPTKRRTQAKREQDGLYARTTCEAPGRAASALKRPQAALAQGKRSAQALGIDSPQGRDGTDQAGPARCAAPEPDPLQGVTHEERQNPTQNTAGRNKNSHGHDTTHRRQNNMR